VSESKDSILDKWVVVKAENRYLNNDVQKSLIGFKQGDFGYSGITDNFERFKEKFKEDFPEGNLITSRISLDEYMLRIVKEGGVHV
jgi:ABC-2 type transport system ATP-binding protein